MAAESLLPRNRNHHKQTGYRKSHEDDNFARRKVLQQTESTANPRIYYLELGTVADKELETGIERILR